MHVCQLLLLAHTPRTYYTRTRAEVLNPQPRCTEVLRELLAWIDRVDYASQHAEPKPECLSADGANIFPAEGSENDLWWLTELSRRKQPEQEKPPDGDEDRVQLQTRPAQLQTRQPACGHRASLGRTTLL